MSDTCRQPSLSPVVVTGGSGFIGSHLVDGLLAVDPACDIHVIGLHVKRREVPGVTYHLCDVTSSSDVLNVFLKAKPRTVFHLACPDPTVYQPSAFQSVNVDGTRNVLTASRNLGTVKAFVYTSTTGVIHDNQTDMFGGDESLPVLQYPVQRDAYALTKAAAETEVLAMNRRDGDSSMLSVSIRPPVVFGERDPITIGNIATNCKAGNSRFQFGSGKNEFDFIYVTNLTDAHILAAQALVRVYGKPALPLDSRVDGQTFNVTNGETMKFWDFQRSVSASIGLPVKTEDIIVIPTWVALLIAAIGEWLVWMRTWGKGQPVITRRVVRMTTISRTVSCERARRILKYEPRISLRDGLEIAGRWFVEEAERARQGDYQLT